MSKLYTDANRLYDGGKRSIEAAPWKHSTQLFEMNQLLITAHLIEELRDHTYKPDTGHTFRINERGKDRLVTSIPCPDKAVNHYLCDEVLSPLLEPYLIHDNGASRVGKGVAFHRRRFEQHMHEFYRKHGNKGYILLGDFKSYYASIDAVRARKLLVELLSKKLSEDDLIETEWLLEAILGDGVGINIGGQPSQNIGISFASGVDSYVKTVMSQRWYARYSDDFYCISDSRDFLLELLGGIEREAQKVALTVHPNKTHIARINEPFTLLQISYRLTESGKLIKRINPKAVTRERRRVKAYKRLVDAGRMSADDAEEAFNSWLSGYYRVLSRQQITQLYGLYLHLFERRIRWKASRLRYLTAQV